MSTVKPTTDTITPRTGKRGLQPWLLTTDAGSTINSGIELSTLHGDFEFNTESTQVPEGTYVPNVLSNSTLSKVSKSSATPTNVRGFSTSPTGDTEIKQTNDIPVTESVGGSWSSSTAEGKVKLTGDIAVTESSTPNTTANAVKEAVNTVKITTNSNDTDSFTESIIIPYRKGPKNDSDNANTLQCTHPSLPTSDDIITIAFSSSESTQKSVPDADEPLSNPFIDVEKSTIDIVQQLLGVKTTIEGLATEIPQTTGMIKSGVSNELKSDPVTESASDVIPDSMESNLTVHTTVVLVEGDKNGTGAANGDTVIADVKLLEKNFSAGNIATVTATSVGDTAGAGTTPPDSQESVRITLIDQNTNETVGVEHVNTVTTSVKMAESNSSVASGTADLPIEKKSATDTATTGSSVVELSTDENTSFYSESATNSDDSETARVVLVPKNTSGSNNLWKDIGKISLKVTATDHERDKNDSSSESSESGENYGHLTVSHNNGSESDSFESVEKETQTSRIGSSENETTSATTQAVQSLIPDNVTQYPIHTNPDEIKKSENKSSSDGNVTHTDVMLSTSDTKINVVVSNSSKSDTTASPVEYTTYVTLTNVLQDNFTVGVASESVTSQNVSKTENFENNSNSVSKINTTISDDLDEIHASPILTHSSLIQNASTDFLKSSTSADITTVTLQDAVTSQKSNSNDENMLSSAAYAIGESNPIIFSVSSEPISSSIPEKYAIFYKADETVISGATILPESLKNDNISQEMSVSSVTTKLEDSGQLLTNSTTEAPTTWSEGDGNEEITTTRITTLNPKGRN